MSNRKKIAAVITEYRVPAHADVIVGKFIKGFPTDDGLVEPEVDIASLYLDQIPENDIGLQVAEEHGIPIYTSINARALPWWWGAGCRRRVVDWRAWRVRPQRERSAHEDEADAAVADEVTFLARALALQPTCQVGYRRNAFVGGRYEPGLRVTFDHSLWTATTDAGLSSTVQRHTIAAPSMMIMEVKANDAVPLWLANMLARHRCELRTVQQILRWRGAPSPAGASDTGAIAGAAGRCFRGEIREWMS